MVCFIIVSAMFGFRKLVGVSEVSSMLQEAHTITSPDSYLFTSGVKQLWSIIYVCPAGLGGQKSAPKS